MEKRRKIGTTVLVVMMLGCVIVVASANKVRAAQQDAVNVAALINTDSARRKLDAVPEGVAPMRSPVAAGLLSFLIPGAGSFYNAPVVHRQLAAGFGFLAVNVGINVLLLNLENSRCEYVWGDRYYGYRECETKVGQVFGIASLSAINWFASIGNAVHVARHLNARLYPEDRVAPKYREDYQVNESSFRIAPDLLIREGKSIYGLSAKLEFR